jgi:hypothetical protein
VARPSACPALMKCLARDAGCPRRGRGSAGSSSVAHE